MRICWFTPPLLFLDGAALLGAMIRPVGCLAYGAYRRYYMILAQAQQPVEVAASLK